MNINEECLLYFLKDTKRLNQNIEKLKKYMSSSVNDKLSKSQLRNKLRPLDV